jgi:hypothetical protein
MLEDKLPSLSRPAGFQPDEEEAEQDARPPSHASSVTSDRYYLKGERNVFIDSQSRMEATLGCSMHQAVSAQKRPARHLR